MDEITELWLAIIVFGLMFGIIIWLMVYWAKNNTVVDERDKKWYKDTQNKDREEINKN